MSHYSVGGSNMGQIVHPTNMQLSYYGGGINQGTYNPL